jgi:uncharacterized membrane protein
MYACTHAYVGFLLFFYNIVSMMSTVGVGTDNYIANFEVTSQMSFFILTLQRGMTGFARIVKTSPVK